MSLVKATRNFEEKLTNRTRSVKSFQLRKKKVTRQLAVTNVCTRAYSHFMHLLHCLAVIIFSESLVMNARLSLQISTRRV
jgi:hypothetical protein